MIQDFNHQVFLNKLNTFLDLFHSDAGFLEIVILSLLNLIVLKAVYDAR